MAMMGIGAGMAVGGLLGGYLSGANKAVKADQSQYQWGGDPGALNRESERLTGFEDAGRANAAADRGLAMGSRGTQGQVAGMALAMAQGKGPSLASQQMEAGLQQAQRAQMAQAAATRGGAGNQLLAQRSAARAGQEMALAVNRDTGMARAQEQIGAMGLAGSLANQQRAQDLQGQQLSQSAYQADMGARYGLQGQQLQANMAYDQQRTGLENAAKQREQAMWGSLTSAGGSMMGMGLGGGGGGGGGGK